MARRACSWVRRQSGSELISRAAWGNRDVATEIVSVWSQTPNGMLPRQRDWDPPKPIISQFPSPCHAPPLFHGFAPLSGVGSGSRVAPGATGSFQRPPRTKVKAPRPILALHTRPWKSRLASPPAHHLAGDGNAQHGQLARVGEFPPQPPRGRVPLISLGTGRAYLATAKQGAWGIAGRPKREEGPPAWRRPAMDEACYTGRDISMWEGGGGKSTVVRRAAGLQRGFPTWGYNKQQTRLAAPAPRRRFACQGGRWIY